MSTHIESPAPKSSPVQVSNVWSSITKLDLASSERARLCSRAVVGALTAGNCPKPS